MEKLGPSHTAREKVKWSSHLDNSLVVHQNAEHSYHMT